MEVGYGYNECIRFLCSELHYRFKKQLKTSKLYNIKKSSENGLNQVANL